MCKFVVFMEQSAPVHFSITQSLSLTALLSKSVDSRVVRLLVSQQKETFSQVYPTPFLLLAVYIPLYKLCYYHIVKEMDIYRVARSLLHAQQLVHICGGLHTPSWFCAGTMRAFLCCISYLRAICMNGNVRGMVVWKFVRMAYIRWVLNYRAFGVGNSAKERRQCESRHETSWLSQRSKFFPLFRLNQFSHWLKRNK